MTGASAVPDSRSRSCRGTSRWSSGSRWSPSGSMRHPGRSPLPGRWPILRWTLPSSASAGPIRLTPSWVQPTSCSARTISRRLNGGPEMSTATVTKIGFVGLGNMGGNMAVRLLDAGYEVYGVERNRERAPSLLHESVRWCTTAREVAEAADIVFTSLPDDGVLDAVASAPDGLIAGLTAAKIWVDMSTVSPKVSRELAERVHALGAVMLDAPVSGSVPQVQAGTLTIMVGGDDAAYTRVEPILRERSEEHTSELQS